MSILCEILLLPAKILDFFHSMYFCMRCFPLRVALCLPVNISHHVHIGRIYRGCIQLKSPVHRSMVYIGHQGYEAVAEHPGLLHIAHDARLVVEGTARFSQGIRLWIDEGATVTVGDNFYCNKNCLFRASDDIVFGRDVLMGWDIEVNTSDGHSVLKDGKPKVNHAPVSVGNHVWIASHAIIAKGAIISDESVVAQRSTVVSAFHSPHLLIGGTPARILQDNLEWQE